MYSVGKFDKSTTTTTKESIACFLWKKNPKKTSPLKKKKRTASLLPDQNIDSCVIYKLFVSVSWFAGCKCKKKRRKLRKRLYMSRRFDYGKCSQIHSYLRLRPLTSFMYSGVTITILDTNALDLNDVQWRHSVSYLILRPLTSFMYSGVTITILDTNALDLSWYKGPWPLRCTMVSQRGIPHTKAPDLHGVQWCHNVSYLIRRPLTSMVYSGVTIISHMHISYKRSWLLGAFGFQGYE